MAEIAQLDYAWEVVNALGGAGQDALRAIELLGGKDPRQRVRDAAERMLGELKRLYEASRDQITASVIAEAEPRFRPSGACLTMQVDHTAQVDAKGPKTRTIADLLRAFKDDPTSNYCRAKYGTRRTYDSHLRTIDRDIGGLAVAAVTSEDYRGWHQQWVTNGKDSMAHGLVGMVKQLFGYGSNTLHDDDCSRFLGTIRGICFTPPKPRKGGLTIEQAKAIRAKAHEMGRPSIALAQAFQFDLKLGQREVIGEWVPEDEPGISDIATKGKKWLRGILWSEIDAKMILRRIIHARGGPKEIEIDLRRAHMISEELAQLGERPVRGPAIICEKSGYPWTSYEFRRWWRQVANAAGVPKTVFNMDSREGRTGANAAALDDYNSADGRLGSDERTRRLIQKVKDTLPKSLTDQVREDVIQEMLLAIHSGEIIEADICRKLCRRYVAEQNNRYDNRYNTLSLDQPAPGKDDGELGDLISSEHSVWSEVP